MCDHFIIGFRDVKLSETLQINAYITLPRALARARPKKTVHQKQRPLRPGGNNPVFSTSETEVDAIKKMHWSTTSRHKKRSSLLSTSTTPRQCNGQQYSFCGKGSYPRLAGPTKSAKCGKLLGERTFRYSLRQENRYSKTQNGSIFSGVLKSTPLNPGSFKYLILGHQLLQKWIPVPWCLCCHSHSLASQQN